MYKNTMRERAINWILSHLDGEAYSINEIGHQSKANPVAVRNAIHYLADAGTIKAEQNGVGRYSRWRFYQR